MSVKGRGKVSTLSQPPHYNCSRSPKRFAKAVGYAFSALAVLYTAIMLLGYSTFGDHTSANLLRNYASVINQLSLGHHER